VQGVLITFISGALLKHFNFLLFVIGC